MTPFNRTYEFRCVFPLLNSTIHILHGDHRAPGVEALLQANLQHIVCQYNNTLMVTTCTQISNDDTSLTFFTSRKEEVMQWKQTIENVTMYINFMCNYVTNHVSIIMYAESSRQLIDH